MSRRSSFINNIITLLITVLAVFVVVFVADGRYGSGAQDFFQQVTFMDMVIYLIIGALLSGFICTLVHELGHVIFGKANGFDFLSMTVWFFKLSKINGKFKFNFVMMGDSAGSTEMIPKHTENLEKRFKNMTMGGIFLSSFLILIGVAVMIFNLSSMPLYCVFAMFLPIGLYCLFGNLLPVAEGGVMNDGAVLQGLKRQTDSVKVALGILAIHSQMYNGKTPAEIDEKLYFDLPQLPEDDLNFAILLNARYAYYLDKGDYENAKKVLERFLSLEDYLPKSYLYVGKAEALYAACTFDYNEDVADDLMYELEKYLNKNNGAAEIRTKLAYILFVTGEDAAFDTFYKKGLREANKCQLKGYGLYERKLLESIKAQVENSSAK